MNECGRFNILIQNKSKSYGEDSNLFQNPGLFDHDTPLLNPLNDRQQANYNFDDFDHLPFQHQEERFDYVNCPPKRSGGGVN